MTRKNKAETLAIAVVEDDPRVRSSLVEILSQDPGCVCVGDYASGEDAVVGLVKHPVRVVIMDIHLPGIDGIEALRRLRADPADAATDLLRRVFG